MANICAAKSAIKVPETKYVLLSDVEPREVTFLWNPYIPRGGLAMIYGEGGIGKSQLTCKIAADLSKGRALPGQAASAPQKVLMISAEDTLAEVLVPRLLRLGAHPGNVALIDETFNVADRVGQIKDIMDDFGANITFIDPLVAYMGAEVDLHRANETREFLDKLKTVVRETDRAIVIVHHTRKADGSDVEKALGSVDITNAPRSTMFVTTNAKTGQKEMRHTKQNWSAPGRTLTFSTASNTFQWVEPSGEVTITRHPRGTAQAFLKDALAAGPRVATEVIQEAAVQNISENALKNAKRGLVHVKNISGVFMWSLTPWPENDTAPAAIPAGATAH